MYRNFIILFSFLLLAGSCRNPQTGYKNLVGNIEPFIVGSDSAGQIHIIKDAPVMKNGILEFDMTPLNSDGHTGVIFRYGSDESWTYLGCDMSADLFGRANWHVSVPGQTAVFEKDINKPFKGLTRRIRVRFEDDILTAWVNGEEILCKELPAFAGREPGLIGFRAWDGGAMEVKNIVLTAIEPVKSRDRASDTALISSRQMEVLVSGSFPRVFSYRWKESNESLYGEPGEPASIRINGYDYFPEVVSELTSDSTILYTLKVRKLKIEVKLAVEVHGNQLLMNVTGIKENGKPRVQTIGFPSNMMVSAAASQPGSRLSISHLYYNFSAKNFYNENYYHRDRFIELNAREPDKTYALAGIAILNAGGLAATIDDNSLQNLKHIRYQTTENKGDRYTGLWSSDWIYRGLDGNITGLPWARVVIASDRNGDKKVDWQDGAIALRSITPELEGAETLRNSFFHLNMLAGSMTQYTFLRWLDMLKVMSLYTDGFGQIFQIKGYQSEGHDSAHPDFGDNFNERAGGLKDLNLLFEGAKKIGAEICLHINHSESYPEAKSYDPEIVSDIPAWKWWDQSYFIKREPDILNGTFRERIEQLDQAVPLLKFVYIDTYREERWIAEYTAKLFDEMGWAIWTEDNFPLDKHSSWVHYAPGGQSRISRFIHHQDKDGYMFDTLLLGGPESRSYGLSDINKLVYSMMTHQLPYRYLMHFPLMKWSPDTALLGDKVISTVRDGQNIISKDGRAIVKGRDIFIPWDPAGESKIYHYNSSGTNSAWELPKSWTGTKAIRLYELTALGRVFVREVQVTEGKVSLSVKNRTPYVLYREVPADLSPVAWSEGSPVKDMGFDSKGFDSWNKASSSGNTGHITVRVSENGNSYLDVEAGDAVISQKITGLEKGRTYVASVWAEVSEGRKAFLGIKDYGGPEIINYTSESSVRNTVPSQKQGNYHKIRIIFRIPDNSDAALVYLKADKGKPGSFVHFDDVRITESGIAPDNSHYFSEDFEHVDEGIFPFVPGNGSIRTHLSEQHDGYTDDVIEGRFSMKITSRNPAGLMAQTLPCNLRFVPGKTYKISFRYKADLPEKYSIVLKSRKGGEGSALLDELLGTGSEFSRTVTIGKEEDYYISINKLGRYEDSNLVIDEIVVDEI